MSTHLNEAVAPVCAAVAEALAGAAGRPEADLAAATPCDQLDLRGLVEHVVGTTTSLARLGLGQPLDPDDPWGGGEGSADGDWSERLVGNLDAIARGWSRADAWTGDALVGGAPVPRAVLGEMTLVEVAAHGWDVARALGRSVELPPEAAEAVREAAASTAELGRAMGAYGPEVTVPHEASALDRALGEVGRDPAWSA